METAKVMDYARSLLAARGDKAQAEAAQKAAALEKDGRAEDARTWRAIESALREMRAPHQG
ncbi:hypothetical protein JMM63_18485 [Rhodovulum sulfidophilum]|uniref:Uncharacterized protein n=1 Tax=Rhodovulum sulfidophilum TaxID=35806 RepID=A0A0D6B8F3_RHOSU|nr:MULTISPECIES: hypothetical protein [Rhodovulum]ANB33371.1 hypothetical protein A6W98_04340 [Rhodovulum sulfidophilum DSM 1374]ANB37192.1 hypothetical protein A6024_04190 [Rhodovulum sulfidophilum]ARC90283.1 hypothetical protein B5V46_17550 [Rhodovulum sp. MB263]MBK5925524.1 hypothetical protein [Rhodovulum sulfidophilum]MBL3553363.1 hypothetical protein [Rhodovulum sulfidophilum]